MKLHATSGRGRKRAPLPSFERRRHELVYCMYWLIRNDRAPNTERAFLDAIHRLDDTLGRGHDGGIRS